MSGKASYRSLLSCNLTGLPHRDDRFDVTIADEKPAAASGGYGQDIMMDVDSEEEEDYEEEELVDKMGNTIPRQGPAAADPAL